MRRALCGAVGVLAAAVAVVPAPSASAKLPDLLRRGQPQPVQPVGHEQNIVFSEGHHRLEEMKVELALLSDIATFPYYVGARARGEYLELRGYVPNNLVRQRAVEVARRSTPLTVLDSLQIQSNLSMRPPLRPARELQRDGAELLHRNLGESADQMSLGVRANGVVVVGGPIDSVEGKLAVSRLFRQLSGCFGVVNEMTVQPIVRDGQHVVQVTKDGSMAVPPSALGLEREQIVASPLEAMPMPVIPAPPTVAATTPPSAPSAYMPTPVRKTPQPSKFAEAKLSTPAVPGTTAMPSPQLSLQSLQVSKADSRMPSVVAPKLEPQKKGGTPDALTTPKLPVKWGQSAVSLDTQVKKLEKVNTPLIPSTPRSSGDEAKMPTPGRSPRPLDMPRLTSMPTHVSKNSLDKAKEDSRMPSAVSPKPETEKKGSAPDALTTPKLPVKWGQDALSLDTQGKKPETAKASPTSSAPQAVGDEAKMPTPGQATKPSAQTKKPNNALAESKPKNGVKKATPPFAETRVAPTPAMTWQRPGSEEGSEPKAQSVTKATQPLVSAPAKPKPLEAPASSSRRWPPAYAPKSEGSAGVIIFDEDPPPSQPAPAATGAALPVAPTALQHQVQSICGRKAREVAVETQRDGTMLVKVKVANVSVEDELSRKILAIPEMTSPQVRLRMDVSP